MKWSILENCGNSPKNNMLVDWIVKIIEGKADLAFVTEETMINVKGESIPLEQFQIPDNIDEIHLSNVITHGRIGAVLGKAVMDNNNYPFSLFFQFILGKQLKIKMVIKKDFHFWEVFTNFIQLAHRYKFFCGCWVDGYCVIKVCFCCAHFNWHCKSLCHFIHSCSDTM